MSFKVTKEVGDFLDEQQKNVKQKIMEDLMEGLFGNIQKNQLNFANIQQLTDLTMSVLVMFNRDVLCHIFKTLNLEHARKDIMKNLFETIKNEVNKKVKLGMM